MLLTWLRAVLPGRHRDIGALEVLQVIFRLSLLLQPRFLGTGQLLLISGSSIPICNVWDVWDQRSSLLRDQGTRFSRPELIHGDQAAGKRGKLGIHHQAAPQQLLGGLWQKETRGAGDRSD